MAAGEIAKNKLIEKIIKALGDSYLGCIDKKYYFMSEENGVQKQVAISMTCPKNIIEVSNAPVVRNGMMDFEAESTIIAPTTTTEVTVEERETVAEMMKRLGL